MLRNDRREPGVRRVRRKAETSGHLLSPGTPGAIAGLRKPDIQWHKGCMKSLTEHLWFEVPNRRGFVNITETVADLVRKSGVQEGILSGKCNAHYRLRFHQ